jgi:peptide/nickel transport system substrate-binding protein
MTVARATSCRCEQELAENVLWPMICYMRGGTCWRPEVKNLTIMVNSIFDDWRMENV